MAEKSSPALGRNFGAAKKSAGGFFARIPEPCSGYNRVQPGYICTSEGDKSQVQPEYIRVQLLYIQGTFGRQNVPICTQLYLNVHRLYPVVPRLYPDCTPNVHGCTPVVQSVLHSGTTGVHSGTTGYNCCTFSVHLDDTECSPRLYPVVPKCSTNVPRLYPDCTQVVPRCTRM